MTMRSCGASPSTVQPTDWQVPRISLTVPLSSRDMERGRMMRAIPITSVIEMFPLCFTFLTYYMR